MDNLQEMEVVVNQDLLSILLLYRLLNSFDIYGALLSRGMSETKKGKVNSEKEVQRRHNWCPDRWCTSNMCCDERKFVITEKCVFASLNLMSNATAKLKHRHLPINLSSD